jgi:hypothetical protein
VFSHAGTDVIGLTLSGFRRNLACGGLVLATFIHVERSEFSEFSGSGWVYPDVVAYQQSMIARLIREAGLAGMSLPWFHPRQTWYAMAHRADTLPTAPQLAHLSGAVLRDPTLVGRF